MSNILYINHKVKLTAHIQILIAYGDKENKPEVTHGRVMISQDVDSSLKVPVI